MVYSVQQIKFELVSYIKEFGGDGSQWSIGSAVDAPEALFVANEVDPLQDVWLWKPAASPAAAALVIKWMIERLNAKAVNCGEGGSCVFIFKKETSGAA